MSTTRKKYYSKNHKTQRKSRTGRATMEQVKQNRMRNKMVRNIRMGRIYRGGGGTSGGGFISQFIGKPWSTDTIGRNYFALSPKGVGTGLVPKFNDGQPLGNARFPTQLGPQVAKLGQVGGRSKSRKRSRGIIGGGIVSDLGNMVDNAKYSWNNFTANLGGTSRPTDPNPYVQPISRNML